MRPAGGRFPATACGFSVVGLSGPTWETLMRRRVDKPAGLPSITSEEAMILTFPGLAPGFVSYDWKLS